MPLATKSLWKSHGGTQGVYTHDSDACACPMTFAVFVPPHEPGSRLPVLWYLSGLTCTHANVMEKGEYRQAAADHGVIIVCPDTSPRSDGVPDVPDDWKLGVSAFAPIVHPMAADWSRGAFQAYLGPEEAAWRAYDAVALIEDGCRLPELLVDQGTADSFLEQGLRPWLLAEACGKAGMALTLRMQEGYDHSYFFISSFMAAHVAWHASRLKA